jgi:PIN domain nuclease of toxin-antitoxin system
MRLLLDTHIFLWTVSDDPRLRPGARHLIEQADEVYVSAASIWEIAIKVRLGKLEADPERLVDAVADSGFIELPVSARHGAVVAGLPLHHNDPFDRLLIAQAISGPMYLLTADALLPPYSDLVRRI